VPLCSNLHARERSAHATLAQSVEQLIRNQ
jgi:hypothetical protein